MRTIIKLVILTIFSGLNGLSVSVQSKQAAPAFNVIAFYTAKNDQAHISFVHEANRWFPKMAAEYGFRYGSTADWTNLNDKFLAQGQTKTTA